MGGLDSLAWGFSYHWGFLKQKCEVQWLETWLLSNKIQQYWHVITTLMLQEKMPCESYQFTIQTLRVKCYVSLEAEKEIIPKIHQKTWCTLCNVSLFLKSDKSESVDVSNQGPQTDTTTRWIKCIQMYGIWSPWDTAMTLAICFSPDTALAICASLCATLYGWHWCTLCHQGLAKRGGNVKWRLSCGLGKSIYKCNVTATFQRINRNNLKDVI